MTLGLVSLGPPAVEGQILPHTEADLTVRRFAGNPIITPDLNPGIGINIQGWVPGPVEGWDDRVGLAVMLVATRRIKEEGIRIPAEVVWVATTQEEIGLRGAQTSVALAAPEIGISSESP